MSVKTIQPAPESRRGLRTDLAFSLGNRALLASSKLLVLLLISRTLGPEGQGMYTYFISTLSLSALVVLGGLEIANNYFGASADEETLRALLGNNLLAGVVCGSLNATVLGILHKSTPVLNSLPPALFWVLLAGAAVQPLSIASGGLLYGVGGFRERFWADAIHQGGFLLLLSVQFGVANLTVERNCWTWIFCQTLSLGFVLTVLLRRCGYRWRLDRPLLIRQMQYGWKAYMFSMSGALNYRLDAVLIGAFLGSVPLGIYSVAVAGTEVLLYLPKALTNLVLTRASSDETAMKQIYNGTSFAMLVLCSGTAIVAPLAVQLMFGPAFKPAVGILEILLVGTFWMGMGQVASYHFFGLGKSGTPARTSLVSALITVVLDIVLIPRWGIHGAAVASTVAYTVFSWASLKGVALLNNVPVYQYMAPRFTLPSGR